MSTKEKENLIANQQKIITAMFGSVDNFDNFLQMHSDGVFNVVMSDGEASGEEEAGLSRETEMILDLLTEKESKETSTDNIPSVPEEERVKDKKNWQRTLSRWILRTSYFRSRKQYRKSVSSSPPDDIHTFLSPFAKITAAYKCPVDKPKERKGLMFNMFEVLTELSTIALSTDVDI